MVGRIEGKAQGEEHAFGVSPHYEDIDWSGLGFQPRAIPAGDLGRRRGLARPNSRCMPLFDTLQQGLPPALQQTKLALEGKLAA
jgi:Phosphoenolpyruvate carboxykinase (GTP)